MKRGQKGFQEDDHQSAEACFSYEHSPCLAPSPAELRVLRALSACGTLRAAADQLCISVHTAASHVSRLRSKSGRSSLHQIVRWAVHNGWLEK